MNILVSLIEAFNYKFCKIENLTEKCAKLDVKHIKFEIADDAVPNNIEKFGEFIDIIVKMLEED